MPQTATGLLEGALKQGVAHTPEILNLVSVALKGDGDLSIPICRRLRDWASRRSAAPLLAEKLLRHLKDASPLVTNVRVLLLELTASAGDTEFGTAAWNAWRAAGWVPSSAGTAAYMAVLASAGRLEAVEAQFAGLPEGKLPPPMAYRSLVTAALVSGDDVRARHWLGQMAALGYPTDPDLEYDVEARSAGDRPVAAGARRWYAEARAACAAGDTVALERVCREVTEPAAAIEVLLGMAGRSDHESFLASLPPSLVDSAAASPAAEPLLRLARLFALTEPCLSARFVLAAADLGTTVAARLVADICGAFAREAHQDGLETFASHLRARQVNPPDWVAANLIQTHLDGGDLEAARAWAGIASTLPTAPADKRLEALLFQAIEAGALDVALYLFRGLRATGWAPGPRLSRATTRSSLEGDVRAQVLDALGPPRPELAVVERELSAAHTDERARVAVQQHGLLEADLDAYELLEVFKAAAEHPSVVLELRDAYQRSLNEHHSHQIVDMLARQEGLPAALAELGRAVTLGQPLNSFSITAALRYFHAPEDLDHLPALLKLAADAGCWPEARALSEVLRFLEDVGQPDQADQVVDEYTAGGGQVDAFHLLTHLRIWLAADRTDRAEALLHESEPSIRDAYVYGAMLSRAASTGDVHELNRWLEAQTRDGVALNDHAAGAIAVAYGRAGNPAGAERRLQELLGENYLNLLDGRALHHLLLGWCRAGRTERAVRVLEQWEELHHGPANPDSYAGLMQHLARDGLPTALALKERAAAAGMQLPSSAYLALLSAATPGSDLDRALAVLHDLEQEHGESADGRYALLPLLVAAGRLRAARDLLPLEAWDPVAVGHVPLAPRGEAADVASELARVAPAAAALGRVLAQALAGRPRVAEQEALACASALADLPHDRVEAYAVALADARAPGPAAAAIAHLLHFDYRPRPSALGRVLSSWSATRRPEAGEHFLDRLLETLVLERRDLLYLCNLQLRGWQQNGDIGGVRRFKERMLGLGLELDRYTHAALLAAERVVDDGETDAARIRATTARTWEGLAVHLRDVVHELSQPVARARVLVKQSLPLVTDDRATDRLNRALDRLDSVAGRLEEYLVLSSADQDGVHASVIEAADWVIERLEDETEGASVLIQLNVAETNPFGRPLDVALPLVSLRILLRSLVMNAIEALGQQPDNHSRRVWVQAMASKDALGQWVDVFVRDNGPGIPPEVRQRIFDNGFTTKTARGLGLGLSLVQSVCELVGGTVHVDSSERGTEFRLRLPAAEPDVTTTEEHL